MGESERVFRGYRERPGTLKPRRFYPEQFVGFLNFDRKEVHMRGVLAVRAINAGLDLRRFAGQELPYLGLSSYLTINGVHRPGGFVWSDPQFGDRPTILIDLSDHHGFLTSPYEDRYALHQDAGWPWERINRLAIARTALEETYHFVDWVRRRLPEQLSNEGRIVGFTGKYADQPHEKRASRFAERHAGKLLPSLSKGLPDAD